MSAKLDEKRSKLVAQGLRKTAISLQAAVVSLLQAAEALAAETEDNLVEHNPLDVNLQDLLKGDINSTLNKLLSDALNNEGEAFDEDQKTQNGKQSANGVKKPIRKPRPPRDPNAPTKPQNAYIFFQKDVANKVKEENKGKTWPEIVHLISHLWRSLSKEEKEIYEHKFEEAKQQYEIRYKEYMQSKDQEVVADANGADVHEETNNISSSATPSDTSPSDDEIKEEKEEETSKPTNARSSRSKVKSAKTSQTDPESSSKKKTRKRKPRDDEDDDESAQEEEEYEASPKKSKKKISNEENNEVQVKERNKKAQEKLPGR